MPKLLTKNETAVALRVCISTIRNMIRTGKLKPIYVGRKVMFAEHELASAMLKQELRI